MTRLALHCSASQDSKASPAGALAVRLRDFLRQSGVSGFTHGRRYTAPHAVFTVLRGSR